MTLDPYGASLLFTSLLCLETAYRIFDLYFVKRNYKKLGLKPPVKKEIIKISQLEKITKAA